MNETKHDFTPKGELLSADRCRNCIHWEPNIAPLIPDTGYCPLFNKETDAWHGSKCTAHDRVEQ